MYLKANLDVDSINTDDEYIDATRAAWAGKSDQKQQPTWRTLRCIDGEDLELSWGYLLEDDIKFSLGKVVIPTASTGETKRLRVSWFNSLIQNQLHYSKKCEDLESRIDKLRQSHEELSNSVEIWQEKATEQENVYFTKFTQILNQKKRKIRQYEKALKQHADFTTKLQSEIAELKSQQQKVKSEKMEFESYQPSSPIVKEEDDYNDINNNDVLFQLEKPERVSTPIKNRSPKRIRELEQDEEDSDDEMVPSLLSANLMKNRLNVVGRQ
ncbi:hypothetical protein HK098_003646 [Nowakowskiella sp. JEL0407]|nr:hypothetical protein HK098_003646 [Nowakowskiella sp. JEL0407]